MIDLLQKSSTKKQYNNQNIRRNCFGNNSTKNSNRAVVTKLLKSFPQNNNTKKRDRGTTSSNEEKGIPAPKHQKAKYWLVLLTITELKGTFMNEQKIRTLRYETRKDEHVQEIQQLSKEEGILKKLRITLQVIKILSTVLTR